MLPTVPLRTSLAVPSGAVLTTLRLADHTTAVLDRPAAHGARSVRPPLILIHALGLDHRSWYPVLEQLPDDRRVIAYDLRGHGLGRGATPPGSLHAFADDLAALMGHLDIESAQVAGVSMGGAIAQTLAVDHPRLVRRLDLIAAAADPQAAYAERAASASLHGMAPQVRPTLERWFSPEFLARDADEVRYARESVLRALVADWVGGWHALTKLDTRPHLPFIGVPVRLVAGGDDPTTPPALMRGIAADLRDARLTVVPDVRHLVSLEAPKAVATLLSADDA
ncbi:alpha/beta fold hydrolase [Streptomyces sp. NPDC060184]|uniref:alpha/beta fold hydrolase n=1 Tax=Streptomyces sp. NPDC060184 TaxID=3347064 RepID=UPI0036636F91